MKSLFAIFLISVSVAWGKPPFNYSSAMKYADDTVVTKVPKNQRIYLFGPEKITESYMLNGKPTERIVEMRRIFSHPGTDSVASLWEDSELDLKGDWILLLYRSERPIEPIIRFEGEDVFRSKHPLLPGDVLLIIPRPKANESVTP